MVSMNDKRAVLGWSDSSELLDAEAGKGKPAIKLRCIEKQCLY